MKLTAKYAKAFSLIEMLVILTVIIILMALIVPKFSNMSQKKEIIVCAGNLKKLGAAFHMYALENNGYAPFNPNCGEYDTANTASRGDYFFAWEAIYLLAPYLNDPKFEKFYNGTLETVRCPGNDCNLYAYGPNQSTDVLGNTYSSLWQGRQAPLDWPSTSVVPSYLRKAKCSVGRQIVDYAYNVNLGGVPTYKTIADPDAKIWFDSVASGGQGRSKYYPLNFILFDANEAVIFVDIQWDNVLAYNQTTKEKYKDRFCYAYNPIFFDNWGYGTYAKPEDSADPYEYMRTNEKIHNGQGVNAVFVDGHVEFLTGQAAYNYHLSGGDDLFSWGISYPYVDVNAGIGAKKIKCPGVVGMKRNTSGKNINGCWTIEQEYKKGLDSIGNQMRY